MSSKGFNVRRHSETCWQHFGEMMYKILIMRQMFSAVAAVDALSRHSIYQAGTSEGGMISLK